MHNQKKLLRDVIDEIETKFPQTYDLSSWPTSYVNIATPVLTICKLCDTTFSPAPSDLLREKHKCPTCSKIAKLKKNKDNFFADCNKKHNGFYDYSRVVYIDSQTHVDIICPVHGVFTQSPAKHKSGRGCRKCSNEKASHNNRFDYDMLISKFNDIHGDKYDYTDITRPDYVNQLSRLRITCRLHDNQFTQSAAGHMGGKEGCDICLTTKLSISTSDYLDDCRLTHNNYYNYYNYDTVIFSDSANMMQNIHCPKHGFFDQRADSHKGGNGCIGCYTSRSISKLEQELADFVAQYVDIIQSDRSILNGAELDIVVPSLNIAFEFCGIYWHTEQMGRGKKYHKNKHDLCTDMGIQLITIFEDEWNDKKTQVKNKIKSIIGLDDRAVVYARKTTIMTVATQAKELFFNEHHIQGNGPSSINYGLYDNNTLVACVGFSIRSDGKYYLTRYATSHRVVGGMSKLLKYFCNNNEWDEIVSFADCRWSNGKMYENTGWVLDSILAPDYSYYFKMRRYHKTRFRKKHLNKWFGNGYDNMLTEYANCTNNSAYRIWDCGKLRYILKNHKNT